MLLSEAMRPSDSTALWRDRLNTPEIAAGLARGMQKLAVIEAGNVESEALAIAVAMREAQQASISTALVTPDRALARRVLAALDRWNLVCNDSGGDSLMETRAGLFARLIAATVTGEIRARPPAGVAEASVVPSWPAAGCT